MNMPVHWPFGKDQTCLAKIHPGNAALQTPRVMAYGNGLQIRKFPNQEDEKIGWHRISRESYNILSQEKDSHTGLPVIIFMPDPMAPDRLAQRQASQKAKAQADAGVDPASLESVVTKVLIKAGVIKVDAEPTEGAEEPPTDDSSPSDDAVSSEAEDSSASEDGDLDPNLGLAIPGEDDGEGPEEGSAEEASAKPAKKSGARKRKVKLKE